MADLDARLLLEVSQISLTDIPKLKDIPFVAAWVSNPGCDNWEQLCQLGKEQNTAVMAEMSKAGFESSSALQGYIFDHNPVIRTCRERYGDDPILGSMVGESRHDAIIAGENGADFPIFSTPDADDLIELLNWWREVTVLPAASILYDLGSLPIIVHSTDLVFFRMRPEFLKDQISFLEQSSHKSFNHTQQ